MRFDGATKDCANIGNVGCQCQHDGNETQDFFVEHDRFVFLYLTCILNGETPNSHSNIVQYDLTIALQKHIQFDN